MATHSCMAVAGATASIPANALRDDSGNLLYNTEGILLLWV
jgi:hypothetical protein